MDYWQIRFEQPDSSDLFYNPRRRELRIHEEGQTALPIKKRGVLFRKMEGRYVVWVYKRGSTLSTGILS